MQQSRLDKAKLIIDRPGDFKVCEACGSIVSLTTAVCPNCNAYRFDSNTEYVVEQAVLLASREQRSVTPEKTAVPPLKEDSFFLIHQTGGVLLLAQIRNAEDGGLNQVGRA